MKPARKKADSKDTPESVVRQILAGFNLADISEVVTDNGGDAQQLIKDAISNLEAMAQEPQDAITGFSMCATRELYRRMLETGDYVGALRAVKQLLDISNGRQK